MMTIMKMMMMLLLMMMMMTIMIMMIICMIGNTRKILSIKEGSFFDRFYRDTESMSPMEKALYLENDNTIEDIHSRLALSIYLYIYLPFYLSMDLI